MRFAFRVGAVLGAAGLAAVLASACGSESSTFDPTAGDGGPGLDFDGSFLNGDGGGKPDVDPGSFWAQDPPPRWCGPDSGAPIPPTPGGTVECPTDKNRAGCPCTKVGETAPCWPGLRVNRNLGICRDGTTTCNLKNEFETTWGPCVGYVPPDPSAKKGKAACKCFSAGEWAIKNVSPCLYTYTASGGAKTQFLASTHLAATDGGLSAACPTYSPSGPMPPTAPPSEPFSSNTLKVDCQGHFKLCFTLKAGDPKNQLASDCTVAKICTEADYPVMDAVTPFPDLPGWLSSDARCVADFQSKGAYAQLSVKGQSWLCEAVDDGSGGEFVFKTLTYCPLKCNEPANKSLPECVNCKNGASGTF